MTTETIKQQIIDSLKVIDDPGLLHAVNNIVKSGAKSGTVKISPSLMKEIKSSREDIAKDMFIENKLLKKEVKEWLKWR